MNLIELQPIYQGETAFETELDFYEDISGEEVAIDFTGYTARMNFVRHEKVFKEFSTSDGTLELEGNIIRIKEFVADIPYGIYDFDFELTKGDVITPGVAAGQIEILNPKTK